MEFPDGNESFSTGNFDYLSGFQSCFEQLMALAALVCLKSHLFK